MSLYRCAGGFSKPSGDPAAAGHMHARSETVDSKPRFCDAFGERRCVIVADTFNVGEKLPTGKTMQWVIRPKDRKPVAMAAIWEDLHDEGQPAFLMLTVAANPLLARAEDRMPAVLDQSDWPMWLGEVDAPFREIKALLRTFGDQGNWEMVEQDKLKSAKPPAPKPPPQLDLF